MSRHQLGIAVALAALLVLRSGEVAIARANACGSVVLNDPATVIVSDIPDLVVEVAVYSDPMDDVCRALLVLRRPTGRVAPEPAAATEDASLTAHLPRAPPAA